MNFGCGVTKFSGRPSGESARSFARRPSMIGAICVSWSRPMKASTSGIEARNSPAKRCAMQPATISFCARWRRCIPRSRLALRMAPMLSSLAASMKEQVLTIITSASSGLGVSAMPALCKWPAMISESTRFFAQPRETRPTLMVFVVVALMILGKVALDGEGFRLALVAVRAVVDAVELDVDRRGNAHVDGEFFAVEADRLPAL